MDTNLEWKPEEREQIRKFHSQGLRVDEVTIALFMWTTYRLLFEVQTSPEASPDTSPETANA